MTETASVTFRYKYAQSALDKIARAGHRAEEGEIGFMMTQTFRSTHDGIVHAEILGGNPQDLVNAKYPGAGVTLSDFEPIPAP
jgi:hypothetical protein